MRLAAAQLYGALFAAYSPEEVAEACREDAPPCAPEYLLQGTAAKVRACRDGSRIVRADISGLGRRNGKGSDG